MKFNSPFVYAILPLFAGMFMQSCSEEDTTPQNSSNSSPTCYVTQEVINDGDEIETITYNYNSQNQIISATSMYEGEDPETTYFEYRDNKIIKANDSYLTYEFDYIDNNSIPSRISLKEGNDYVGYYAIQSQGSNITEFEEHSLVDGEDFIDGLTTFQYDNNNNVSNSEYKEYDEETSSLETLYTFKATSYDKKNNPYNKSFVFFFMDTGNPSKIGNENLISGMLDLGGVEMPYTATYEYNSNDYPTDISISVLGLANQTTVTYDCK